MAEPNPEVRCEAPRCRRVIPNARKGQRHCNGSCRKAAWVDRHIPRCPHCRQPLEVALKPAEGG